MPERDGHGASPAVTETIRSGHFGSEPGRGALGRAVLCLLLLAATTLRVHDLGAESYWIDEASMLKVATAGPERIAAEFRDDGRPPVYVWLAYGWTALFGTTEVAARSLSALFSIAAVLLMYVVGKDLFGRRVGLLSAAFMTFSPLQISQAQNFRYYSLMVFLTLASFCLYYRAVHGGRIAYFVGWVVTSLLLFYTHFFAVFVLVAQTFSLLLTPRRYRTVALPWLVSHAVIYGAVVLQLVIPVLTQMAAGDGTAPGPPWIRPESPLVIVQTLRDYLLAGVPRDRLVAGGGLFLLALLATWQLSGVGLLNGLRGTVAAARTALRDKRGEVLLSACWLVLPIVLPFMGSLLLRPMYVPRYTLSAAPALYLLLAFAVLRLRRTIPPLLPLAGLVLLIAPALHTYYTQPSHEQWREVTQYVEAAAEDGDRMVLVPQRLDDAWNWYSRGRVQRCDRGQDLPNPHLFIAHVEQCAGTAGDTVWVVSRNSGLEAKFNADISTMLARRGGVKQYDFHLVRLYVVTASGQTPSPAGYPLE